MFAITGSDCVVVAAYVGVWGGGYGDSGYGVAIAGPVGVDVVVVVLVVMMVFAMVLVSVPLWVCSCCQ